ncbi:hypothetical protein AAY473_001460 [Plecturocebus cupreus]
MPAGLQALGNEALRTDGLQRREQDPAPPNAVSPEAVDAPRGARAEAKGLEFSSPMPHPIKSCSTVKHPQFQRGAVAHAYNPSTLGGRGKKIT